jgi:predicted glutamine amidotransferase
MCRLLGVVASETTTFGFSLHEAPRSLAVLSNDHPDGWGLAVHGASGWELTKHAAAAHSDERYLGAAARARGEMMVAHIRKRTVGPISTANTHPFRRGEWIFAHNGTIEDVDHLRAHTADVRAAEVEGQTDSERLFAYLLTAIDRGISVDPAVQAAVDALIARPKLGAANFLLSNGKALYAFRFGRTLFLLARQRGDEVRQRRSSPDTNAELETPWSVRRRAFIIASEKMTDEPYRELAEGTLLRIDGGADPDVTVLRGSIGE